MTFAFLSRPVSRRQLTVGALSSAAAATLLPRASFAQATPLAGTTYPELTVTITDRELSVSSTSIPAGFVLLTVVNQSQNPDAAGLLGPGAGQTMDQLQQAAATPTPGEQFPSFLYTATVLGGPGDIQPGKTGQAIINVPAGPWAVIEEGNLPPVFITATAGGATQPEPQAVLTITEVDFAFGGFDQPIKPGPQIWKVVNTGTQPHMLDVEQVPPGTTIAQVLAFGEAQNSGTPSAAGLTQDSFTPASPAGVLLQSSGTTVWPLMDLAAGHYVAMCFVPDERTGQPHLMEGMIAIFDVGAPGTPVATPAS